MAVTIKNIEIKDLEEVVRVHNSAFKGFFLTDLGPRFLKLYYRSVAKSDIGILLGAFDDSGVLTGFCAACQRSNGFNQKIVSDNIVDFGMIGLHLLITKPSALIRLIKNITKKGNNEDDGEYAELLSIAVDKRIQHSGTGKAMLSRLEDILKAKNIQLLSLTTDGENNSSTLSFYRKQGFREYYKFIAYPERPMYRLIKNLNNQVL